MNQSYKKNLEFIKNAGVEYFLQDSPRNWFEKKEKDSKDQSTTVDGDKNQKIKNIIESCSKYKTIDRWILRLSKNMSSDFDADEAFIHVKIKADKRLISSRLPKNSKIDKLSFKSSLIYCGSLDNFNQKKVIGEDAVKSIVFCPLHTNEWSGFFYLGSLNPDRYSSSYEPDLLNLLASVLKLSISMQLRGSA